MALISCPDCNKEISDTSEICVGCGYQVAKVRRSTKWPKRRILVLLASSFAIITGVLIIILSWEYSAKGFWVYSADELPGIQMEVWGIDVDIPQLDIQRHWEIEIYWLTAFLGILSGIMSLAGGVAGFVKNKSSSKKILLNCSLMVTTSLLIMIIWISRLYNHGFGSFWFSGWLWDGMDVMPLLIAIPIVLFWITAIQNGVDRKFLFAAILAVVGTVIIAIPFANHDSIARSAELSLTLDAMRDGWMLPTGISDLDEYFLSRLPGRIFESYLPFVIPSLIFFLSSTVLFIRTKKTALMGE